MEHDFTSIEITRYRRLLEIEEKAEALVCHWKHNGIFTMENLPGQHPARALEALFVD